MMKYLKDKKSYSKYVKDNPNDRIEIEVGDIKDDSKFHPQFKLKRWDNEVNFSVRLKDTGNEEESDVLDTDKIKWQKGTRKADFYEVGPCREFPEGGYEFEIAFDKKPKSNRVEFSIETKGLNFEYQPDLNNYKIRPPHVVGSYAVFAKENKINYKGGKEYKTGKVGHIYRPLIVDANGTEVWGELNINTKNKTLVVIIPQGFLDNATYPINHVAGLTFGYTTGGASQTGINDTILSTEYTCPSAGTATSMSAYVRATSSNGVFKCAMYDTDGDYISGSITEEGVTPATASFVEVDLVSSYSLSADDYYLAVIGDNTGSTPSLYWDSSSGTSRSFDTSTYDTFVSSLTLYTNRSYSVYTTYTSGASEVDITKTLEYRVETDTDTTKGLDYTILTTTGITRGLSYAIVTDSDITKGLDYEIKSLVDVTKGLSYTIITSSSITKTAEYAVSTRVFTREANSSLPSNDDNLSTGYSAQDYIDVMTDDGNRVSQIAINDQYSIHEFKIKNTNDTDSIVVEVDLQSTRAPSSNTVYLQIFNQNSALWETIDSNSSSSANTDFTLSDTISTNVGFYYTGSMQVSCRVYQEE